MKWPMVALGELMADRRGSIDPQKYPDEEFELFSIPAYDKGGAELTLGANIGSTKKCIKPGDVLISRIVPHIRRVQVVSNPESRRQIASSEWLIFHGNIHPDYLKHYLLSDIFHIQFMRTVAGVGGSLLRARPAAVKQIQIPLPPLDEQRRIAAILDRAAIIESNYRSVADHLDALTQAAFHKLFGSSTTLVSLGSIANFGSGATPNKKLPELWSGSTPWFSAKDLKSTYLKDSIDHVSNDISEQTSIKTFPPMTNAIVVRGMILSHTIPISILEPSSTINQDLKAILPINELSPEYINAAVKYRASWLLSRVTTASHGTKKLETDLLSSTPIPNPTTYDHARFLRFARSVHQHIQLTERARSTYASLLTNLQALAFQDGI